METKKEGKCIICQEKTNNLEKFESGPDYAHKECFEDYCWEMKEGK